ncbi:hypothetical protein ACJ41O_000794 [Fusarium nematophilum]
MSLAADSKITLFLWLEGFFPKQIVYFLLLKGLASPSQLYSGKTNDPRLSIKTIVFNGTKLVDADPSDPKPVGKSTPCLRIVDPDGEHWVHESSSILRFLEGLHPEEPRMVSSAPLDRALMDDIQATVYQAFHDCNYYIKNAASVTTSWSGMKDEERSLAVARHAKTGMVKALVRAQDWAGESLRRGGWLTPGLDNPGLVDVALATGVRYMELSYSLHLLEDERLGLLRSWYARFKEVPWWQEVEESGRHPESLAYPSDCREV